MKALYLVVGAVLLFLVIAGTSIWSSIVEAQLSVDQAKDLFTQLGCTSCHNGAVAISWDDMLADLRAEYEATGSLDELARETVYFGQQNVFDSWDALMDQMAKNVGKNLDDPDIQKIKEFLEAVAKGEIQIGAEKEAPKEGQTQEQPEEQPKAEEGKGIPFGLAVAIAAVIVIVVVAGVYMVTKK